MSKIEVGMRVRCVDPHDCTPWYEAGSEGVVKDVDTDGDIRVEFDHGKYRTVSGIHTWFGAHGWFEVVTA